MNNVVYVPESSDEVTSVNDFVEYPNARCKIYIVGMQIIDKFINR